MIYTLQSVVSSLHFIPGTASEVTMLLPCAQDKFTLQKRLLPLALTSASYFSL